ncbi:MAG: acyltransferase [Armatimonadetes bacterium]|nr:acyltransferase [Armatimonadota bacterium]
MKVGFLQFDPHFGEVDENLQAVGEMMSGLSYDLLILPELFNSGYLFRSVEEVRTVAEPVPDGPTTRWLREHAKGVVVAGIPEREGNHLYNSAVVVGPKEYFGKYRKIHLFSEENRWFEPGNRTPPVFDLGKAKIGVMICFDWIFPETARTLALQGAEIICHPANPVLPYCPQSMPTRCLENRVFSVTCNRTGVEERGGKALRYIGQSQITAPDSTILTRAGEDEITATVLEIDPAEARNKNITEWNHLLNDRKPHLYKLTP